MSDINSINAAANYLGVKTDRAPNSNLGKDEFLKLLVVQLANQNPLEPMNDQDFIAQMAQFSSLEQMQNLNNSFLGMKANSMIGKTVIATAVVIDEAGYSYEQEIIGRVDGIIRRGGKEYLSVGNFLVDIDKVTSVFDESDYNSGILAAQGLIGKTVEAFLPGAADSDEPVKVEGIVSEVFVRNGQVFVIAGEKEIPVAFITRITGTKTNNDIPQNGETINEPQDGEEQ